jgi:hypothetical protein
MVNSANVPPPPEVSLNAKQGWRVGLLLTLFTSLLVVVLWLLAWMPVRYLPAPLHWFLFWFGGLLTLILLPALCTLVWSCWRLFISQARRAGA